jgi:hypothetical protein
MKDSRRRLMTLGLAGLCAALAVLSFVPPSPAPPPESRDRVSVAAPAGTHGISVVERTPSADSAAFRRPIFLPSRRLPGNGSGGAASVGGLTLKAVFLGPEMKKALLGGPGTRDGRWVTPGQTVDGWKVEEIHAESVVLSGPDGRSTLELEKPEAAPASRQKRASPRADRNRTEHGQEPE